MPNVTVKKSDGSSAGDLSLSEAVFGAKINIGLMHQAVLTERTNSRQGTQSTKNRAAVAGGGKKPYRQKGTGRARQGTVSAPHYRHGGVALGPLPRDFSAKMTKKARRAAIISALSAKNADSEVIILESLQMDNPSTKRAATLLSTLGVSGRVLVVLPQVDQMVYKSFRNLPGAEVRVAPQFSVQDILSAEHVVIVQSALDRLNAVWGKTDESAEEGSK